MATVALQAQTQASLLQVAHRHGQSFVTWSELPSNQNEHYRVYRDSAPIQSAQQLARAEFLAEVPRGSGMHPDLGQGYVLQSAGLPLQVGTGVLVVTAPVVRVSYYAVTTVVGSTENLSLGPQNTSGAIHEVPTALQPILQHLSDQGRDRHYVHFAPAADTPFVQAQSRDVGRPFDYRVWVDPTTPGPRPVLLFLHPKGGSYRTWRTMPWAPLNAVQVFCDDKNPPGGNDFWFGYHADYPGPPKAQAIVHDYSERRVMWTLDQVVGDRRLLCDANRVYAMGASLGAISAAGLGLRYPDRFAACAGLLPAFSLTHADFGLSQEVAALFGSPSQALPSSLGLPIYDVFEFGARLQATTARGVAPMRFTFGRADAVTGWEDKPPLMRMARQARQPLSFYWDIRAHTSLGSWSNLEAVLFAELMEIRLDRPYPALTNLSLDDDPGPGSRFAGDPVGTVGGYAHFDPWTAAENASLVRVDVGLRDNVSRLDHAPQPRGEVDLTFRRLRSFAVQQGAYYLARSRARRNSTIFEERILVPDQQNLLTVRGLELERTFRMVELSRYVPTALPELRFSGTLEIGGTFGMQMLGTPGQVGLLTMGGVQTSLPTAYGSWQIADATVLWAGIMPSTGLAEFLLPLPKDPSLRGLKFLGQGFVWPRVTNLAKGSLR